MKPPYITDITPLGEVAAERRRQFELGWTSTNNDVYTNFELARAAACYAKYETEEDVLSDEWPWDWKYWKPTTRRRNLIKAAALIIAEIERLDRLDVGV